MKDKRKDELRRRAKGKTNRPVMLLTVLSVISVLCMMFLISRFISVDVIIPNISLQMLVIVVTIILVIISAFAISNARDLGVIKEIVLDNKIILEDTVQMESIAMDEILKLKEITRDIKAMVE